VYVLDVSIKNGDNPSTSAMVLDGQANLKWASQALVNMLGYKPSTFESMNLAELMARPFGQFLVGSLKVSLIHTTCIHPAIPGVGPMGCMGTLGVLVASGVVPRQEPHGIIHSHHMHPSIL
jgi:hypothetical protein